MRPFRDVLAGVRQRREGRRDVDRRPGPPWWRADGARRLNPEDLLDWDRMTTIIANAEPWFSPGTSCAYHAYTFGFIIGEVIRRVDGRAFGRFLHEEIAAPHGLDVYVGLPADHDDRVSPLHAAATASSPLPENMDDLALATLTNPAISVELRNTTAWWRAEVPSSNGQATARSLAQLCGLLADDDPQQAVLNAATVDRLVHGGGPCNDRVLGPFMSGATMDWTLGFMRNPVGVFGASPTAFGYTGMEDRSRARSRPPARSGLPREPNAARIVRRPTPNRHRTRRRYRPR